jgi:LacI family transcriptional regulator
MVAAYQARASYTIDDARQAALRLLDVSHPPSAVVCDSDFLAVGVYKAARDVRRSIPRDLSVVSFDDSVIARMLEPELTSVAIPTARIGEQALLLLLAILETGQMPPPASIPLELIVRASTTKAEE